MNGDRRAFVDTNVVIYLFSGDEKAERSEAFFENGGVANIQVLNEFVSVARAKIKLDWPAIRETLTMLHVALRIDAVSQSVHDRALHISEAHGLHIYDAAIVAAAAEAGCETLLTEDLQHGRTIDGIRIENPYR
jgi:predicted nucleic acid-binding protein